MVTVGTSSAKRMRQLVSYSLGAMIELQSFGAPGSRFTVRCVTDHDGGQRPEWLEQLEPEQMATFRAFGRPQRSADRALRDDPRAEVGPHLNPALARRVFDREQGAIDLVPGVNTICCLVVCAGTGERISGSTSTVLAACGAHGFTSGGQGRSATFRGVLASSVRELRIITASGEEITAPVNDDDAYWITIADPIDQILTHADGTQSHVPFSRPGSGQPPRRWS